MPLQTCGMTLLLFIMAICRVAWPERFLFPRTCEPINSGYTGTIQTLGGGTPYMVDPNIWILQYRKVDHCSRLLILLAERTLFHGKRSHKDLPHTAWFMWGRFVES